MNRDWPSLIPASYAAGMGDSLCGPAELEEWPAVVQCHDTAADPVGSASSTPRCGP